MCAYTIKSEKAEKRIGGATGANESVRWKRERAREKERNANVNIVELVPILQCVLIACGKKRAFNFKS